MQLAKSRCALGVCLLLRTLGLDPGRLLREPPGLGSRPPHAHVWDQHDVPLPGCHQPRADPAWANGHSLEGGSVKTSVSVLGCRGEGRRPAHGR